MFDFSEAQSVQSAIFAFLAIAVSVYFAVAVYRVVTGQKTAHGDDD